MTGYRTLILAVVAWLAIGGSLAASAQVPPAETPQPEPARGAPPQDPPAEPGQKKEPDIEELRRRIDLLAAEIEQLRSAEPARTALTPDERRTLGLGPSAAAVYESKPGVSLAGYGEMLYENYDAANESGTAGGPASRIDFLRAIVYTGYRFNDRFLFNSEIEVEHTNEIGVEFAYVDFRITEGLSARGGLLLVPLGLVNEFHEPNVFLGARRPIAEQRIIPSTWRENGFGLVGSAGRVNYRAYLVNGFNAAGFSADGLRGGRQKGGQARAADWAFAGRVDVSLVPGAFVGAGLYHGGSDQAQYAGLDVGTTIVEVHGQFQARGLDLRGLYVRAALDDVAGLNQARNLTGRNGIGEVQVGGYAQAGYNVLSQYGPRVSVIPYYRFERVNTHAEVPTGYLADPSRDVWLHTLGLDVKPIGNIVLKADYQWIRNEAKTGRNQFNIALGYAF